MRAPAVCAFLRRFPWLGTVASVVRLGALQARYRTFALLGHMAKLLATKTLDIFLDFLPLRFLPIHLAIVR